MEMAKKTLPGVGGGEEQRKKEGGWRVGKEEVIGENVWPFREKREKRGRERERRR